MKIVLLFSALMSCVVAHAVPNSLTMSCAEAKAYIARHGSVVLATGEAYASFSTDYCPNQVPAYVCTSDVRFCNVGVYCDYNYTPLNPPAYMQGTDLCSAKN
jgi:hypothetical protein